MKYINKFQQGGPMPVPAEGVYAPGPEEAPEPRGLQGGDPITMIAQAAIQAVQSQDGNMALQACEMFLDLLQQGAGPREPEGGPAAGEPVFRKGGKLCKRVPKRKKK